MQAELIALFQYFVVDLIGRNGRTTTGPIHSAATDEIWRTVPNKRWPFTTSGSPYRVGLSSFVLPFRRRSAEVQPRSNFSASLPIMQMNCGVSEAAGAGPQQKTRPEEGPAAIKHRANEPSDGNGKWPGVANPPRHLPPSICRRPRPPPSLRSLVAVADEKSSVPLL